MGTVDTQSLRRRFLVWSLYDRYLWKDLPSRSPRFERRQAISEALLEAEGFDSPRDPEPLTALSGEGVTREALLKASDHLRRPVVVRGFAAESRAARLWTKEYLRERLGEETCTVFRQDEQSRKKSWDLGTPLEQVSFSDYLDSLGHDDLYMNNSVEFFAKHPDFLAELEIGRIREAFTDPSSSWDELLTANLFIGSKRVYSAYHAAPGGNFFLNLVGRKRWLFIDPIYGAHLHALTSRPFQYVKSAYGGTRGQEANGELDGHVFTRMPRYEVVLEPGDLLYNAPWWWHEVDNLDDFTVGCAVRHFPTPLRHSPSWSNHFAYSLSSVYLPARAAMIAHWLRQRATGEMGAMRDIVLERQVKALHKGLGRKG